MFTMYWHKYIYTCKNFMCFVTMYSKTIVYLGLIVDDRFDSSALTVSVVTPCVCEENILSSNKGCSP